MKNLKNKIKNMKGITLIALIITIIVLLILAGVVINMTVGNEGIIGKAQGAVDAYKNATEKEEYEIAKVENEIINSNRGTVTLTDEEYMMFKSEFSKNGGVSINKPNTWQVGTEYNFGDGVYGQRFVGTFDQESTGWKAHLLSVNWNHNYSFIDIGGYWKRTDVNTGYLFSVPSPIDMNDGNASCLTGANTELQLCTYRVSSEGSFEYDVWVIYKK